MDNELRKRRNKDMFLAYVHIYSNFMKSHIIIAPKNKICYFVNSNQVFQAMYNITQSLNEDNN